MRMLLVQSFVPSEARRRQRLSRHSSAVDNNIVAQLEKAMSGL